MSNMMRSATNGTINKNATSIIKDYLKLHHEQHHEKPIVVSQQTMQKMVEEKNKFKKCKKTRCKTT
jgi:hypothetical protein